MSKKIKYVHFIVMILSCLILSGCFDMEGRVEIRKDGSGIVSYALVTDPSFAEAFKQSKCFTQGEKVRNYIKEGKFYHEGSKTFSSLAELDLKDEKISVNESRYEHIIYPEKQQNSQEDRALSVLLLKGHFFTYNLTLPESVRKAYPVEIGGIEIEPTIKDNTASWKIPMELIASAEKEVIFKADLTKPFSTSIPQNISEATVTGIIDGDTLEVTYGNEQRQIRLIGIDTPETVVNDKTRHDADKWKIPVQRVLEMGEEATRYVESIVKKGDKIKLEFEDPKVDPHNRLLSYVHLKDGRFLNAELLRKGYAITFFRDWKDGREFEQKRYNDEFQKIEEEAKRNKVGFWKIWLSTTNIVKRLDLEISEVSVGHNKNELSLLKDKRLTNRGIEIVQKIVDYLPAATNQRIGTWKFGVIEGDNAYGGGGNIIAGRDILEKYSSDAIAFVMAHEMAHSVLGHRGIPEIGKGPIPWFYEMQLSREQEKAADDFAMTFMQRACFKVEGAIEYFENECKIKGILGQILCQGWPPTHPHILDRLAYAENRAKNPMLGQPMIVSNLEILEPLPYRVDHVITAKFTIKNAGNACITFDVLTVGGRLNGICPQDKCPDFECKTNVSLAPNATFDYEGKLRLDAPGNYHFFTAYRTKDGQWNTAIPTDPGVTNIKDIFVEKGKSSLDQPPIPYEDDETANFIWPGPISDPEKFDAAQWALRDMVLLDKDACTPRFTPDGKKVIYTKLRRKPNSIETLYEVWTTNLDGKNKQLIVKGENGSYSQKMDKLAFYDTEEWPWVFSILDMKTKKKYKLKKFLDIATGAYYFNPQTSEIRWANNDEIILFGDRSIGDVSVFDLNKLAVVATHWKGGSIEGKPADYDDVWTHYNAVKNVNSYVKYYIAPDRSLRIKNRDNSYDGVLFSGVGDNLDVNPDFSKIVFDYNNSIYIARLVKSKDSTSDVIFKINFGKAHDCFSNILKYYEELRKSKKKGYIEILSDIYAPDINPLNNKILGSHKEGSGPIGKGRITQIDNNYSVLKLTAKNKPEKITKGNVAELQVYITTVNEGNKDKKDSQSKRFDCEQKFFVLE